MSMGLNRVYLIGRAGKDAELRTTANGTAVATFSLATNRSRRNADGDWTEETDWHTLVLWGRQAEFAARAVTKGCMVAIEGSVRPKSWIGPDNVKHYRTDIVVERILWIQEPRGTQKSPEAPSDDPGPGDTDEGSGSDDDLPPIPF